MLEEKVEVFLERKQFTIQDKAILVGVSGGPDSLALLHFLWRNKERWNLRIMAAHVDHMFRGKESEEDAYFVKNFCEERNIPFEMKQVNIPRLMEEEGLSSQVAAREGRYEFFKEILCKYRFSILALGHHGDDQVETILMRLTRGSTGKARSGIPFSRTFHDGVLVRPFLCLNREEIEEYCRQHHLNPRRDPSNDKAVYSRNRFRKTVLPFLKQENPSVHEHFLRFSEEVEQDEELLQSLTAEQMKRAIINQNDTEITVDIGLFQSMPLPLQRRGIQLILNYLYNVRPTSLSALHIEKVFSLIKNPHPSGTLDFPEGLKVVRSYEKCHFQFQIHNNQTAFSFELGEPGEVTLPNGEKIKLTFITNGETVREDPFTCLFRYEEGQMPLHIRTRKEGERMTVLGMKGTKKLKKLFIDEKVPLHERNSLPIVTDSKDQIIWVPGLRRSNLYVVDEEHRNGQQLLLLTYEKFQQ